MPESTVIATAKAYARGPNSRYVQVPIPAAVQRALGLQAGDKLEFRRLGSGSIRVTPIHRSAVDILLDGRCCKDGSPCDSAVEHAEPTEAPNA